MQGVFYRASAKKAADNMHIKGWVKNMDAGHVEITASGTDVDIERFINWCKQGPPRANVSNVVVTKKEDKNFDGFEIV